MKVIAIALILLATSAMADTLASSTSGTMSFPSNNDTGGWKVISSAPHDGTIVEVRCTYGVAPWYGLFKWTNKRTMNVCTMGEKGKPSTCKMETMDFDPGWVKVGDEQQGFTEDDAHFFWRPYKTTGKAYVDPTNGAQDTTKYWRDAVKRKYGR